MRNDFEESLMNVKRKKKVKEFLHALKKKYKRNIEPYISLVAVMLIVVSVMSSIVISYCVYYSQDQQNRLEADEQSQQNGTTEEYTRSHVFLRALENTAVSLTGDVILPIEDAERAATGNTFMLIMLWIYMIARIIFPAVCLIFIVGIVKKIFRYSLIWFPHIFRTEIAIFGYNDRVAEVLDHSDVENYKVYLVLDKKLDDEVEELLFSSGASLIYEPLEKKEYFKYRALSKCKYFLFMDEDSVVNVSVYMSFCQDAKNNRIVDRKRTKFYIQCSDASTEKMLKRYSDRMTRIVNIFEHPDKHAAETEILGNDELRQEAEMLISDVDLFSYMDLLAQKTYNMLPLYQYNIDNNESGNDVHMFIGGFSEFGQAMFYHGIMLGVFGSESEILIDIVDSDAEMAQNNAINILANFENGIISTGMSKGCPGENSPEDEEMIQPWWEFVMDSSTAAKGKLTVDDGEFVRLADGRLHVRIWQAQVVSDEYSSVLERICSEKQLTYAASCFCHSELNMRCIDRLSDIVKIGNRIPLVVNLQEAKGLRELLTDSSRDDYWFSNVHFTMSDTMDLGLDEIISFERSHNAAMHSMLYNMICSFDISEENYGEAEAKWAKESLYNRMSTLNQVNGDEVKKYIMKSSRNIGETDLVRVLYDYLQELREYCKMKSENKDADQGGTERLRLQQKLKGMIECSEDEKVAGERSDEEQSKMKATFEEWARIEHRRWCYYMLLTGHSLVKNRDGRNLFNHDTILCWEDMEKRENFRAPGNMISEKRLYDLIPYLMIADNAYNFNDGKIIIQDANCD